MKFNYRKRDLPKTEDELVDHLAYTFKLLDELYNYADIIVAGNEPFIESKLDQRGDVLVTFYQVVAGLVNNYQTQKGGNKPIYVGAFNRLWEPKMQKDATALFTFARETPWIAGVDLHIHHASNEQFNTMMEFAEARLRDDQTIIATEFSLMHHWRQSLTQPIPNILHTQYSYPNDWKVYTRPTAISHL